jgi:hypothetical protein
MGTYKLHPEAKKVYQMRPKVSAACVSDASQGLCFVCIRYVPRSLLDKYQMRPKVSARRVSDTSQLRSTPTLVAAN